MREFVYIFGWATLIACGLFCLGAVVTAAVTRAGSAAMESKEFFDVVVRYAAERKKKRVMGIDE